MCVCLKWPLRWNSDIAASSIPPVSRAPCPYGTLRMQEMTNLVWIFAPCVPLLFHSSSTSSASPSSFSGYFLRSISMYIYLPHSVPTQSLSCLSLQAVVAKACTPENPFPVVKPLSPGEARRVVRDQVNALSRSDLGASWTVLDGSP